VKNSRKVKKNNGKFS